VYVARAARQQRERENERRLLVGLGVRHLNDDRRKIDKKSRGASGRSVGGLSSFIPSGAAPRRLLSPPASPVRCMDLSRPSSTVYATSITSSWLIVTDLHRGLCIQTVVTPVAVILAIAFSLSWPRLSAAPVRCACPLRMSRPVMTFITPSVVVAGAAAQPVRVICRLVGSRR